MTGEGGERRKEKKLKLAMGGEGRKRRREREREDGRERQEGPSGRTHGRVFLWRTTEDPYGP